MNGSLPKACPACGNGMHVRVLSCPNCHTEVQGDFSPDRFQNLGDEQLQFLETFLRCRGSLKDVGTQLNVSYPTARNRLDSVLEALGLAGPDEAKISRLEVLQRLKDGEIGTQEALSLLQKGVQTHE